MVKMLDKALFVRVKKEDEMFVKKFFSELEKKFKELLYNETGREYTCKLTIDSTPLESEWYLCIYSLAEE